MQYSDFGIFLRKKREGTNISLNQFALESDVDSATISRIETGKQGISLSVIAKIASFYGIKVSELITEYESGRMGKA